MKTYELKVTEKELNEWSKSKGEGDYLGDYDVNMLGQFTTEKLSIMDIVEAIKNIMCVEIDKGNISFCNEEMANFDIIENEEGYQDEQEGDIIARYGFTIKEVIGNINLEKMFG